MYKNYDLNLRFGQYLMMVGIRSIDFTYTDKRIIR